MDLDSNSALVSCQICLWVSWNLQDKIRKRGKCRLWGTENYYPPVISKERFYNLQTKLNIRTETHDKIGRESKGFRNIFKGVIFCEHCDTALHQNFTKRKGKEYMYLICAKSLVGACPSGRKVFIPYGYIVEPFYCITKTMNSKKLLENPVMSKALLKTVTLIMQKLKISRAP